jgi:hypothetical protein
MTESKRVCASSERAYAKGEQQMSTAPAFHPETQRHNTVNSIKDGRSKYQLVKSEGPINSKFEAETKLQLLKDTINHHVLSSIFMPIRCELQA